MKKKETGFNYKLFDKVVAHFRKYPGNLAMDVPVDHGPKDRMFSEYTGNGNSVNFKTHCGTVGCMAGWTAIFATPGRSLLQKAIKLERKGWDFIQNNAVKALRIPKGFGENGYGEEGQNLFHVHKWPEPFRSRYEGATNNREKVRAALARFKDYRREVKEFEQSREQSRVQEEMENSRLYSC